MGSRLAIIVWLLIACGTAMADPGWGIVLDRRGNLFYTDLKHVWKLEPSGRRSIAVPDRHTHELYIDGDDNLYGEHLWYEGARDRWWHSAWRLSPDGRLTDVVPTTAGFRSDHSLVRDAAGAMYWWRDRKVIMKRLPDGRSVIFAGGSATPRDGQGPAAGFAEIGVLAFGDNGYLYTVDAADRLRRIAPDGRVRTVASGLDRRSYIARRLVSSWHYIMGIAADRDGNVYLAYMHDKKLKKVSRDGRITTILENRDGWSPTGVAIRGSELYVLEYGGVGKVRVRRVARDGKVTSLS